MQAFIGEDSTLKSWVLVIVSTVKRMPAISTLTLGLDAPGCPEAVEYGQAMQYSVKCFAMIWCMQVGLPAWDS